MKTHLARGGSAGTPTQLLVAKHGGGQRTYTFIPSYGEIIWKAATTDLAHEVDRSQLPEVVSGRLHRRGAPWLLRGLSASFEELRSRIHERAPNYEWAVVTDMKSFYESIHMSQLRMNTSHIGEPGDAARRLTSLAHWQDSGLVGLPIGPDTSEVYGSFTLHRMDIALKTAGYEFVRLMDDIVVWLPQGRKPEAVLELVDGVADDLRVQRSREKTQVLPADEVEDYLVNAAVDYHLSGGRGIDRPAAIAMFHESLEVADNIDVGELAFSVGWFARHRDSYPVKTLIQQAHVLPMITKQIHPLIRDLTRVHKNATYPFFKLILDESAAIDEATRYCMMVGLAHGEWGRGEGIAADRFAEHALPPLRAAGLRLMSRTPELGLDRVVDRALRGQEMESRGATLALYGLRERVGIRTAAKHIRSLRPERSLATNWATGAA